MSIYKDSMYADGFDENQLFDSIEGAVYGNKIQDEKSDKPLDISCYNGIK